MAGEKATSNEKPASVKKFGDRINKAGEMLEKIGSTLILSVTIPTLVFLFVGPTWALIAFILGVLVAVGNLVQKK